MVTKNKERTG